VIAAGVQRWARIGCRPAGQRNNRPHCAPLHPLHPLQGPAASARLARPWPDPARPWLARIG